MTSTLFRIGVGAAIVAISAVPLSAQRGAPHPAPVASIQAQGRGPAAKPATPAAPSSTSATTAAKPAHTPPHSIPDHLANQPELVAQLRPLLPPGTDLNAASTGFKNLGEFVAAIHVAHNLGLSFDALKAKITGPNAESLGAAIHDLKPAADATAEIKSAEKATKADLAEGREKNDRVLKSKSSLEELPEHPQLESRIQPLLPAGSTPVTAASGFKTMGDFLAAVHVSHDLGIPFDQLKTALTGPSPESLGKAIQALKPGTPAAAAVQKADAEARQDLNAVNPKSKK